MCRNLYWILEDWKCLRANGCLRTASQKLLFSCAMDMPWSAVSPWKVYIYIYIYAYRIRTVSISVWFRVCCKFVVSTDSKLKSILNKGQKETHEFCDLTTSMVGFFFWPEQIPEFGWRKQGTPSTGWITKVMESHLDSPVMFLALMISFTTFPSTTAMFVVR